jgi:hypothetical protein
MCPVLAYEYTIISSMAFSQYLYSFGSWDNLKQGQAESDLLAHSYFQG